MTIGLYDADINNIGFCAPNINLMKLASYYKKTRDLVAMVSKPDPIPYTKFYYSQDYEGEVEYNLLKDTRVQFSGKQFDRDIWLPATIEECVPDTSIYSKYYSKITNTDESAAKRLLEIEHARLSLDNKTIWTNWKKQIKDYGYSKTIMFHDTDLGSIAGAYEELLSTMSYRLNGLKMSIAVKYPIQIYNTQELKQWTSICAAEHMYLLQVNYTMSITDAQLLTSSNRTAYYNVTHLLKSKQDFLMGGLPQILQVVKIFSNNYNQILLIYDVINESIPLASKIIDIINDFLIRGRLYYGLKQFIYQEYPQDARLIITYLKDQSPASYQWL